jgi:hypothetical protein
MENRLKRLSLFEFQPLFPNDDKCEDYLANLKWKHRY